MSSQPSATGYRDGNLEVMRNVDLEKAHQILRNAFRPGRRTSVNTFLIHSKAAWRSSNGIGQLSAAQRRLRSNAT